MSFPQAPPPGAYVPPNESNQQQQPGFNPQQSQYYQPQGGSYQPAGSGYAPPQAPPKTSTTAALNNMYKQAMTTSKPMLNKFGKTLSSKLGSKPAGQPPPQHLESYQNYHQQQYGGQSSYSPQPQQQQWGQQAPPQQQPPVPNAYSSPQQSPYQSNYATPASGHSGQSNYFPQQQGQAPSQQTQSTPNYNPNQGALAQIMAGQQQNQQVQGQAQQGQFNQGQPQGQPQDQFAQGQQQGEPQGQPQGQPQNQQQGQQQVQPGQPQEQPQGQFQGQFQGQQQEQPQGQYQGQFQGQQQQEQPQGQFQGQFQGQQQEQPQGQFQGQFQGQQQGNFPQDQSQAQQPQSQFQQAQSPQGQFTGQQTGVVGSPQLPVPNPVPGTPQAYSSPPPVPAHPNQPQQQQQPSPLLAQAAPATIPSPSPQQYNAASAIPAQPNQQQPPQQWPPMSPMVPPSVSPPPQSAGSPQQAPPIHPPMQQPQQEQQQQQPPTQPTPPPQKTVPPSAPTEFIAELPADLGNLTLVESKPEQPTSNAPPASQYQAYQPPSAGPSPSPAQSFTIPRRAVSMSNPPLADPWRMADPVTEVPTREFYIMADLLFDALDRRFEPQNTGLLEASKILESWKLQELPVEVSQLFEFASYTAFAKLWSLMGVPHVMVPCQPALTPLWTFQPQTNSESMKIALNAPAEDAPYPEYMPALNRAGWYKYLFIELLNEPETLSKMMSLFCSDTYKPGVMLHPDLQKQDRTEIPALTTRAKAMRGVLLRVCQESAASMQAAQGNGQAQAQAQAQSQAGLTEQEAALKMQSLKMQQQMNNMMNQQMIAGGQSMSMAAENGRGATPAQSAAAVAHGTGAATQQDEALRAAHEQKIHQMKIKMAEQQIMRSSDTVDFMGGYGRYSGRPTTNNDF